MNNKEPCENPLPSIRTMAPNLLRLESMQRGSEDDVPLATAVVDFDVAGVDSPSHDPVRHQANNTKPTPSDDLVILEDYLENEFPICHALSSAVDVVQAERAHQVACLQNTSLRVTRTAVSAAHVAARRPRAQTSPGAAFYAHQQRLQQQRARALTATTDDVTVYGLPPSLSRTGGELTRALLQVLNDHALQQQQEATGVLTAALDEPEEPRSPAIAAPSWKQVVNRMTDGNGNSQFTSHTPPVYSTSKKQLVKQPPPCSLLPQKLPPTLHVLIIACCYDSVMEPSQNQMEINQDSILWGVPASVQALEQYLRRWPKVQIHKLVDYVADGTEYPLPSSVNILEMIQKVCQDAADGDSILFYYAGHALLRSATTASRDDAPIAESPGKHMDDATTDCATTVVDDDDSYYGGTVTALAGVVSFDNATWPDCSSSSTLTIADPVYVQDIVHTFMASLRQVQNVVVNCVWDIVHGGTILDMPYQLRGSRSGEFETSERSYVMMRESLVADAPWVLGAILPMNGAGANEVRVEGGGGDADGDVGGDDLGGMGFSGGMAPPSTVDGNVGGGGDHDGDCCGDVPCDDCAIL
jgi:hypothetical protein